MTVGLGAANSPPSDKLASDMDSNARPYGKPSSEHFMPHVVWATRGKALKGEDVMFVQPPIPSTGVSMFMVCDGHQGGEAAQYVASQLFDILLPRLPPKLPNFSQGTEVEQYAEQLRRAFAESFVKVDNEWTKSGHFAGTTVTVALVTGWLLTVANVGDSTSLLDTGRGWLEMSQSHRIQVSQPEQNRLRTAGALLSPLGFHLQGPAGPGEIGVGPLRLWPGGLSVGRSVGDLDAGAYIMPVPHIKQLLIPEQGARLIIASDGLWDVFSYTKVVRLMRPLGPEDAAQTVLHNALRDRRMADDISIIVADFMPNAKIGFPAMAISLQDPAALPAKGARGLFQRMGSCFRPTPDTDDPSSSVIDSLQFWIDVDCLLQYPLISQMLARQVFVVPMTLYPQKQVDYTLHGGMDPEGSAGYAADASRNTGANDNWRRANSDSIIANGRGDTGEFLQEVEDNSAHAAGGVYRGLHKVSERPGEEPPVPPPGYGRPELPRASGGSPQRMSNGEPRPSGQSPEPSKPWVSQSHRSKPAGPMMYAGPEDEQLRGGQPTTTAAKPPGAAATTFYREGDETVARPSPGGEEDGRALPPVVAMRTKPQQAGGLAGLHGITPARAGSNGKALLEGNGADAYGQVATR